MMYENNSYHSSKSFSIFWASLCIIATVSTVSWQVSNYLNGRDATVVEYRKFNDRNIDLYPSIGLCFTLAIDVLKLKPYGVSRKAYSEFLSGRVENMDNGTLELMLKIDYDQVSIPLEEIVLSYGVITNIWEDINLYSILNLTDKTILEIAPGLKDHSMFALKCFSIDIPYMKSKKLLKAYVHINGSIFPSGIRPAFANDPITEDMFLVNLHYPRQCYRHMNTAQNNWPVRNVNSSKRYSMEFNVRNVEVLELRNKYQDPCSEGIPDFDKDIPNWIMDKNSCKPPYWNSLSSTLSSCSTLEQFRYTGYLVLKAVFGALDMVDYDEEYPCRSLEKIQYDSQDIDLPHDEFGSMVSLVFNFKEFTYKEIKSVRGMDLQGLIGNIL